MASQGMLQDFWIQTGTFCESNVHSKTIIRVCPNGKLAASPETRKCIMGSQTASTCGDEYLVNVKGREPRSIIKPTELKLCLRERKWSQFLAGQCLELSRPEWRGEQGTAGKERLSLGNDDHIHTVMAVQYTWQTQQRMCQVHRHIASVSVQLSLQTTWMGRRAGWSSREPLQNPSNCYIITTFQNGAK